MNQEFDQDDLSRDDPVAETFDPPAKPESPAAERAGKTAGQFSIRTLMIATTALGLLCTVFFAMPGRVGGIVYTVLLLLTLPAILSAIIYGRGATRAFAIGSAVPMTATFCWLARLFPDQGMVSGVFFPSYPGVFNDSFINLEPVEAKIYCVGFLFVVFLSGLISQLVRRWCLRRAEIESEAG